MNITTGSMDVESGWQRQMCARDARWFAARSAAYLTIALGIATHNTWGATSVDATVELPVWSRTWTGTLGGKSVIVELTRTADALSGDYCYQPCADAVRLRLQLTGTIDTQEALLTERDMGAKTPDQSTGVWMLKSLDAVAKGTWSSPDGKRTLPVVLSQSTSGRPFPYDIRLLADALPKAVARCTSSHVSAILLYRQNHLVQELPTDSRGTCSLFIPEVIDANFDGWPDLRIQLGQGAGPNEAYQTWLFDPNAQRLVDAPRSLQDVLSPVFDPAHRMVWSEVRASCCEYGLTTYRWQKGELKEIEAQSSYTLPVLDGTTRRYCLAAPDYADGHIYFPRRVEQSGHRLTLTFKDIESCDTELGMPDEAGVDIWHTNPGGSPQLLKRETSTWARVSTSIGPRFCPEVPFFAHGAIQRIVLRDDPARCSGSDPRKN
ncbi:XAC2610-related protein [Paraburkholderia sp. J67]|uniref:XAC2610-related protein n=1 Tax=Paraburkholderia sp. J67 TaxID=2805435 RepID=UPI002ABE7E00|nr:nitrite reductase [Paraburkholderia sp. J67]